MKTCFLWWVIIGSKAPECFSCLPLYAWDLPLSSGFQNGSRLPSKIQWSTSVSTSLVHRLVARNPGNDSAADLTTKQLLAYLNSIKLYCSESVLDAPNSIWPIKKSPAIASFGFQYNRLHKFPKNGFNIILKIEWLLVKLYSVSLVKRKSVPQSQLLKKILAMFMCRFKQSLRSRWAQVICS